MITPPTRKPDYMSHAILWPIRALVVFLGVPIAGCFVLRSTSVWNHPVLTITALLISSATLTCATFTDTRVWFRRVDWRLGAVIIATALSTAITIMGFAAELESDQGNKFLHDVFAGWVSGFAFFGLVGLVATVASLAKPEDDRFDQRVSILFRGEEGKHIDYITQKLREVFEHYAEDVHDEICVAGYDYSEEKFFLISQADTTVRSYITDVATTYQSRFGMTEVAEPPPAASGNRLVFLKVGESTIASTPFNGTSLSIPLKTTIDAGGACLISYKMEYWSLAAKEENNWSAVRYTKRARSFLQNNLPGNETIEVDVRTTGWVRGHKLTVAPGERVSICAAADIPPDQVVWDFRILPLTRSPRNPTV